MKGRRYALYNLRQAGLRASLEALRRQDHQELLGTERWEPWSRNPVMAAEQPERGPPWLSLIVA